MSSYKKFEKIDHYTDRIKVPGGWLVRTLYDPSMESGATHTIFIADLNHNWKLED